MVQADKDLFYGDVYLSLQRKKNVTAQQVLRQGTEQRQGQFSFFSFLPFFSLSFLSFFRSFFFGEQGRRRRAAAPPPPLDPRLTYATISILVLTTLLKWLT